MNNTTDINLEFWLFLKNLIEIKKNAAVFDSQTVNLLKTIQNNVTDLLNQVKNKHVNIHNPPNNEYELLRDANKDEFQFQRFLVCQICNTHLGPCGTELQAHLNSRMHCLNVRKQTNVNRLASFNPTPSSVSSVPDVIRLQNNRVEERPINNTEKASPKLNKVLESMTNKDNVNEIIYQSCVLSNTIKNNKLHTYVEHSLLLSISERYGNLNLYPYGSRVYDAASMESDFNVFLDFGEIVKKREKLEEYRTNVQSLLQKYPKCWDNVEKVDSELLGPCLRAFSKIGSIQCVLTFNAAVAVATTKFLKHVFKMLPACRHVILYIKTWQRYINENLDENEIGFEFDTYLLTVLVIFMFQHRKVLPSIAKVQENEEKQLCGDIEVQFGSLVKTDVKISIEEYILNFFTIYGHYYQPKQHVISIYAGEILSRKSSEFTDLDCMCILDIFNKNANVSGNVPLSEVKTFQKYCRISAQFLKRNQFNGLPTINEPKNFNIGQNDTSVHNSTNDLTVSMHVAKAEASTTQAYGQDIRAVISKCVQESYINASITKNRQQAMQLITKQQYKNIALILKSVLPSSVELYLYGSRTYGAGSENSDLNIFVDFARLHNNRRQLPREEIDDLRNRTEEILRNHPEIFTIKRVIDSVYSPLLEVYIPHDNLSCTLSFASGVSVAGCNLIKDFFKAQPLCHELTVYLKDWIEKLNVNLKENEKISFNNYLITILVIFSLQIQNLLPSVHNLQTTPNVSHVHCGDVHVHYRQPTCVKPTKPITEYLFNFFKFYGQTYNPRINVISPFHGNFLSEKIKNQKNYQHNFPKLWKNRSMYVQDLFNLKLNIAADIKQNKVDTFQRCCRISVEELCTGNQIRIADRQISQSVCNLAASNIQTSSILNRSPSLSTLTGPTLENVIKTMVTQKFKTESIMKRHTVAERLKIEDYSEITNHLNGLLKPISKHPLECYVFGSRMYGVATDKSDLNILVDFGNFYNKNGIIISKDQVESVSQMTLQVLKQHSSVWQNIKVDRNCQNAPALKVIYKPRGIRCNLVFNASTSVATSQYIESVLDEQKMCRQIIFYLQQWQEEINKILPNAFNFNNYILTLMVFTLFEIKQLLPRILNFRSEMSGCGGYLVLKKLIECPKANNAFGKYLLDFFELYGTTFNPQLHIISPYCGELVRQDIESEEIKTKSLKLLMQELKASKGVAMRMQDIFRVDCNVTRNITASELQYFQRACQLTARALRNSIN